MAGVGFGLALLDLFVTTTLPTLTRAPMCLSAGGSIRRQIGSTLAHVALRRGITVVRTRSGFDSPKMPHLNVPRM